jgi:8-oxo-dGTP diphosphatase
VEKELEIVYGNKVRVRACGLCWQGDSLLLINHKHLGVNHFWAPPGGGIEVGMTARATVINEFVEETGLTISVGKFLFACEFIKAPLHAVEVFFEVSVEGGHLISGFDPETKLQIISESAYKDFKFIQQLPKEQKHGILAIASTPADLRNLRGYIQLL